MRADMGGAATVCSAIVTAAALNLPLNIIGKCVCVENPKVLVLQSFVREKISSISNGKSHVETSWTLAHLLLSFPCSTSLPFLLAYNKITILYLNKILEHQVKIFKS